MDIVKNPNGTVVVTVEVEGDLWNKAKKQAFNQYKKNLKVNGFRKGQIPPAMAKKLIPDDAVTSAASESKTLMDKVFRNVLDDEAIRDLNLIDQPTVTITGLDSDKVVYQFTLQTEPEAEIGNYKALGIEKTEPSVTDEEVDEAVQSLLARNADWVLVEDGESKKGDRIKVEMTEEGDDEEAEEMTLIIGANQILPEFEEKLTGLKPMETKTVTVTYPENYMSPEMAGQEKSYVVSVKEIYTKDIPELNDEAVEELEFDGIHTVEELKDSRRKLILDYKTRQADAEYEAKLISEVAKMVEVEVPNAMIEAEVQNIISNYAYQMSRNGFSLSDFLEASGLSVEQLKETTRSQAIDNIKGRLALDAIVRDAGLAVSDEELDTLVSDYAQAAGIPEEEAAKSVKSKANRDQLLVRKAVDYLKSVQ